MFHRGIILAFYRGDSTGSMIAQRVRRLGFRRSAFLKRQGKNRVRVENYHGAHVLGAVAGALLLTVCTVIPYLFRLSTLTVHLPLPLVIGAMAAALAGAIAGWKTAYALGFGVTPAAIAIIEPWMVGDESVVMVEASDRMVLRVLSLLRDGQDVLPATFVFHDKDIPAARLADPGAAEEQASSERLGMLARNLAASQSVGERGKPSRVLLQKLEDCERTFNHVRSHLTAAARGEQGIELSGEWLLDNAYIIRGHIDDYRKNLPREFYKELPVLGSGQFEGLPRVYGIATVLVAETRGRVDSDNILSFLAAYQSVAPLTMGELWALPLMIRLALIEHLQQLMRHVERRQRERELSDFWANRLMTASRIDPGQLLTLMTTLERVLPDPSPNLADQLVGHLFDENNVLAPLRTWLEAKFGAKLSDTIAQEQRTQAIQQVSLANGVSSLRSLAQMDWRDLFESASVVDLLLRTDPAGIYTGMDFATRDRYRHVIEQLARHSTMPEIDVTLSAVQMAEAGSGTIERHVGYYLIDNGRSVLERQVRYRVDLRQQLQRMLSAHPALTYVGSLAVLTALGLLWAIELASTRDWAAVVVLGLLALFPLSEIAVQITNFCVTTVFIPTTLPKMSFEAEGISENFKTLVVIPMMLLTPASIEHEVERLEIRALANPDKNLRFALLSDYSDADHQIMPEDAERLDIVIKMIQRLNHQYGERFCLFQRDREWSDSEQRWMGWERKRGKLEDMNRLLIGEMTDRNKNMLRAGNPDILQDIRFVITLDADTQLPRGTATRLVATLAHPLNQPKLSADSRRVERGYTIIQPRVTTSLPSATATLFSRLFTDPTGIDPYTHAVSDVYQDLAGEGIYHGKGIYDLRAFDKVLSGLFPESHLLSHDLIEGSHVRVGLATDIELFDLFPPDYVAASRRQHRWIRGDWQIADWLMPTVPIGKGQSATNPLSKINRWKIFDNLRRSLIAPACVLLLLIAWISGLSPAVWTTLVVCALALPVLFQLIAHLTPSKITLLFAGTEPWASILRAVVWISLLPHQALVSIDSIARVWYRRNVSHRSLLEWETSQQTHLKSRDQSEQFFTSMLWIPVFSLAVISLAWHTYGHAPHAAMVISLLWIASPVIVAALSQPTAKEPWRDLSLAERRILRALARRTWRFFDFFVNDDSSWLPPDNFQENLNVEVAQRTSPTNVGMWMLSAIAANDIGYITVDDCVDRLSKTFATVERIEKYEGHLLNWYDTRTCEALHPRYVSMVDSGNLLGDLWTIEYGLLDITNRPIINSAVFAGLQDTAMVAKQQAASEGERQKYLPGLEAIERLCTESVISSIANIARLRRIRRAADQLSLTMDKGDEGNAELAYWLDQLSRQSHDWCRQVDRYIGWIELLDRLPESGLLALGSEAHDWRRRALATIPTLRMIAGDQVPGLPALISIRERNDALHLPEVARLWLDQLAESYGNAQRAAVERMQRIEHLRDQSKKLSDEMNMGFLYSSERRLFAVGYNLDDRRLDTFYYDLLASEARLGSFVSVARGDVPVEHWFALGRPISMAYGKRVLMSWSGTMFEYLMPLLVTRSYDNSLLDSACDAAVGSQIAYGKKRGVPWGISESGYSALDARKTYQYQAFGVPGLGIKRHLEDDLVIAPYATALALMVDPKEAVQNIQRLASTTRSRRRGEESLLGPFGFYESIDYTRQRDVEGDHGVIVRSYMAHHQGMSLLAITNVLNDNIMQDRFHSDPRVKATESLLFERIPTAKAPLALDSAPIVSSLRSARLNVESDVHFDTANTATPKTHLLSNNEYSVLVTNSGGGYSRWKDYEITRWRSDTARDLYGSFVYVKDVDSGEIWSNAFHPIDESPRRFATTFSTEKAEIRGRHSGIEVITEIVVSPEDNAEVRRLTIVNHTSRQRTVELTSYIELALNSHAADKAHPAFSKLFVQTEALKDVGAVLASRRPRSSGEQVPWAAHVIAVQPGTRSPFEFETDRSSFIGRGGTLKNPAGLDGQLGGGEGAVLDPCFSLRQRLTLRPSARASVAFVTIAGDSRDTVARLAQKYAVINTADRALELAWTAAQLDLRHLRIQPDEAMRFQQLAAHVLYPDGALRPADERLRQNKLGQTRLWAHGISGDLPMVVVTVSNSNERDVVRQVLMAHAYWRVRGVICDLIIIDQEAASYEQPLMNQLRRLVDTYASVTGVDVPGGVFLRPAAQIPPDDMTLLLSAARVVIVAARGGLSQQLGAALQPPVLPGALRALLVQETATRGLPFLELTHFNGIGGFTPDGREYAIYLDERTSTPAPWINVMANPNFGVTLSESGAGYSWYGNSQSNKLTPWSNDPVLDRPGDALYIRDEEMGVAWSPTPLPIRELDAYRARHGQGYTMFEHYSHAIEQELTVFVPVDDNGGDPVRVQILRLKNASPRRRKLTVTMYAEWVLGTDREETQVHLMSDWDAVSGALLARNPYNPNFGNGIAFISASETVTSYTGDRVEFLGRNGSPRDPEALHRVKLSNRTGAALDPCGAIQVQADLEIGQTCEFVFLLGQATDLEEVRRLAKHYRDPIRAADALKATKDWWDAKLGVLQVKVPEEGVDYLLNRWLLYQDLSCRIWGRSAFYQSGGAFGFRDQLQDVMALVYADPDVARRQILRSAARQFIEGDVQHWWHEPSGAGVRTQISDDLLWLPFVTAQYIRVTGDAGILDEVVTFIEGPVLKEGEHEAYNVPEISKERESLLEHCRRAIAKGHTSGAHGLPLIGAGDWNDGLNRVGAEGKGESVWLAWFLIHVLNDFAEMLRLKGGEEAAADYEHQAAELGEAVEAGAWDGEWYVRAYYDDGTPLGSHLSDEAKVDSLAQSWAVISGAASKERSAMGMAAVMKYLVDDEAKMVKLFTPAFDKTDRDPGYIKGYVPGVRENGGQYTHGSLWVPLAFARMGDGASAVKLLNYMSPVHHSMDAEVLRRYRVEPYVVVADIYALANQHGRGGWSWYTGSAGWMYRVWIEEVLGFTKRGDTLRIEPRIPNSWSGYSIAYKHLSATYEISIVNLDRVNMGILMIEMDGLRLPDSTIPLSDDGAVHRVRVVMGNLRAPSNGLGNTNLDAEKSTIGAEALN